MKTMQKIKKMIFIALGFALATYLIMSGMAILDVDSPSANKESVTY